MDVLNGIAQFQAEAEEPSLEDKEKEVAVKLYFYRTSLSDTHVGYILRHRLNPWKQRFKARLNPLHLEKLKRL